MQFQRAAPNAVLVSAPVEAVREAAWYALVNERIPTPIIDTERNIVVGTQGDGILTVARVTTARFQPQGDGTIVSFESKPVLGGFDFGAKKRAQKLADSFESVLSTGYSPSPLPERPQISQPSAPIADPFGPANTPPNMTGQPIYGSVLATKRGGTVLAYGVFSLICCQILVPVTLIYGIIALNDYRRMGDPGDKWLVIAGMGVSVLGILGLIALFGFGA
ncbi:hypothetical protein EON83_05655 [bacterium]|nr:MAG: hypothetical protein EON83_05655 [bacterium]